MTGRKRVSKPLRKRPGHVVLLNPATCGIWKKGGVRYKVDHATGTRLPEIDNELGEHVATLLAGQQPPGAVRVTAKHVFERGVLVPRYFDDRWVADFKSFVALHDLHYVPLGTLVSAGVLELSSGHGSPSNDLRGGHIPYIKVSDVRGLRLNVNPTNRVSRAVAEQHWGGSESGLCAWDLVSPNRASSNIGEFAVVLPGEEERVLTKEFFVFRVVGGAEDGWDWAYMLWAFCLRCVRKQWQRVTLMQTNREDVGDRWREILIPVPKDAEWGREVSEPFRSYFTTIADGRRKFLDTVTVAPFEFIASVSSEADEESSVEEDEVG